LQNVILVESHSFICSKFGIPSYDQAFPSRRWRVSGLNEKEKISVEFLDLHRQFAIETVCV